MRAAAGAEKGEAEAEEAVLLGAGMVRGSNGEPEANSTRPSVHLQAGDRRAGTAAAVAQESVNEEEDPNVAEERVDPAGPAPADEPLPENNGYPEGEEAGVVAGEETPAEEQAAEEPPPPPAATRPRPGMATAPANASLRARLAQRLQNAK